MKETLAVIPARGGSVRIPRKNLVDLGGKPLLLWTTEAAERSELVTRFVVSTEDVEIAALCKRHGIEWVPQPLPSALSGSMSAPVVRSALDFLRDSEGYEPEYICLLHPTSPFRTAEHIDACIRLAYHWSHGSVLCYTNDVENGAVLVKRASLFRRNGSFMEGAPIMPYSMDERSGLDINTWDDLERARNWLR